MADEPKIDPQPADPKPKTYDQAYVTRLENEAAKHRLAADAAEKERDELKAYRDAREKEELEKKGEYDKALAKLEADRKADAEKHAAEIAKRDRNALLAEAKVVAIKAGIIDPSDVASLDLADLRMDETGKVAGLDEKITELKASKPHWFKGDEDDKATKAAAKAQRAGASSAASTAAKTDIDWATKSAGDIDAYLKTILRT